jgi:hypothetical protein
VSNLPAEVVALSFTASARRLGMVSALGTVFLGVGYAVVLIAGLLSLQSPHQPIADPLFSILEILIILTMPLMVTLMVAIHAWAPSAERLLHWSNRQDYQTSCQAYLTFCAACPML